MEATIVYKPNAQKTPGLYDRILTEEVLRDICIRVTGQSEYQVQRDTSTYNKGRLIYVIHNGVKNYVSLSETSIDGRNSSLQSVPTAINLFYADKYPAKRLYYYFLPHVGNPFTDYHMFVYKLLLTAKMTFLNLDDYYPVPFEPYTDIDEMISNRDSNRGLHHANHSSYITRDEKRVKIHAKVAGANKYESTLIVLAAAAITDMPIDLYFIGEGNLACLPQASLNTIQSLRNVTIHL